MQLHPAVCIWVTLTLFLMSPNYLFFNPKCCVVKTSLPTSLFRGFNAIWQNFLMVIQVWAALLPHPHQRVGVAAGACRNHSERRKSPEKSHNSLKQRAFPNCSWEHVQSSHPDDVQLLLCCRLLFLQPGAQLGADLKPQQEEEDMRGAAGGSQDARRALL